MNDDVFNYINVQQFIEIDTALHNRSDVARRDNGSSSLIPCRELFCSTFFFFLQSIFPFYVLLFEHSIAPLHNFGHEGLPFAFIAACLTTRMPFRQNESFLSHYGISEILLPTRLFCILYHCPNESLISAHFTIVSTSVDSGVAEFVCTGLVSFNDREADPSRKARRTDNGKSELGKVMTRKER